MSILDDAIREHLELKRAHGADADELKKLEDEAFGPPARPEEPEPFAEAPAEFLVAPEEGAEGEEPRDKRAASIVDLQEAPEMPAPEGEPEPQGEVDRGHSTEERHAIAEQPTEHFDVEGQFEDAAVESDAPSDEELVDAEMAQPRLAPVDPLAGLEDDAPEEEPEPEAEAAVEPAPAVEEEPAAEEEPEDEFDEFFSEQRLSDELNQALEAPLPDEPGAPATEEATAIYRFEDEEPAEEEAARESHEPEEEEASDEHALPAEEASEEHELPEEPSEEDDAPPPASHEDVLEDTPDFLEDAPDDDNLWFEQKPPKDFDFDD
jgi:hypothetical protein